MNFQLSIYYNNLLLINYYCWNYPYSIFSTKEKKIKNIISYATQLLNIKNKNNPEYMYNVSFKNTDKIAIIY